MFMVNIEKENYFKDVFPSVYFFLSYIARKKIITQSKRKPEPFSFGLATYTKTTDLKLLNQQRSYLAGNLVCHFTYPMSSKEVLLAYDLLNCLSSHLYPNLCERYDYFNSLLTNQAERAEHSLPFSREGKVLLKK